MAFASPEKCAPSQGAAAFWAKTRVPTQRKTKKRKQKATKRRQSRAHGASRGSALPFSTTPKGEEESKGSTSQFDAEELLETRGKMYGSNDDWRNGRPQEPN